jgi:hypothetical protein
VVFFHRSIGGWLLNSPQALKKGGMKMARIESTSLKGRLKTAARTGQPTAKEEPSKTDLFGSDLYCRKEPFGTDLYCQKPPFGSDLYFDINSSTIYR